MVGGRKRWDLPPPGRPMRHAERDTDLSFKVVYPLFDLPTAYTAGHEWPQPCRRVRRRSILVRVLREGVAVEGKRNKGNVMG